MTKGNGLNACCCHLSHYGVCDTHGPMPGLWPAYTGSGLRYSKVDEILLGYGNLGGDHMGCPNECLHGGQHPAVSTAHCR